MDRNKAIRVRERNNEGLVGGLHYEVTILYDRLHFSGFVPSSRNLTRLSDFTILRGEAAPSRDTFRSTWEARKGLCVWVVGIFPS